MGLQPERRLWFLVVLQTVAEQDEKNVLVAGKDFYNGTRARLAQEAREIVASDDFIEMCELAGVSHIKARKLTPERAQIAFTAIQRGEFPFAFEQEQEEISEDAA